MHLSEAFSACSVLIPFPRVKSRKQPSKGFSSFRRIRPHALFPTIKQTKSEHDEGAKTRLGPDDFLHPQIVLDNFIVLWVSFW